MNRTTLLAVGAGLLLLVAGLPAAAAAAPADAPTDNTTDDRSVGPSDGLPSAVPEFVGDIHEAISSFLNGDIADLGKSLSGLVGNGSPANAASA